MKVLDFGLAKALDPPASSPAAAALYNSPTITSPAALSAAGVILGTAAYMSPEQARGKVLDRRSDIWAFGAVLFEMLTGTRAFRGDDVTDTIAAVIAKEPDWTRLGPETPAAIRRLLRRCLEKDRARRLSDAADARLEIDDALAPSSANATLDAAARPVQRGAWLWAVTGGAGLLLGVAIVLLAWAPWRSASPPALLRLSVELGADVSFSASRGSGAILSPDGAVVAFVAQPSSGGPGQLYVRRLNQLQASPLSGTDGADSPFFSPDGQWIAFFAGGTLKKVSITYGPAVTLCDVPAGRGDLGTDARTLQSVPSRTTYTRSTVHPARISARARRRGCSGTLWACRAPGGRVQISSDGGFYPMWSRTKREPFYGTLNGEILVAPYVAEGDSFRAEKPRLWSDRRYVQRRSLDLHPDGERFALAPAVPRPSDAKDDHVTFIFNFFDELRRIAPATRR